MKVAYFLSFCCLFLFVNRALGLGVLGAGVAMGARLSVGGVCFFLFVNRALGLSVLGAGVAIGARFSVGGVCVGGIMYLLLHGLRGCAFDFGFLCGGRPGLPQGNLHLIVVEQGFPAQSYKLIDPKKVRNHFENIYFTYPLACRDYMGYQGGT